MSDYGKPLQPKEILAFIAWGLLGIVTNFWWVIIAILYVLNLTFNNK